MICFFFSSRRRHTRCSRDWSSDVCSSDLIDADAEFLRQLLLLGAIVGHKFVKRRVDQANGDGKAVHGFEDADEITALERQEPVERSHAGFLVVRENHLLNGTLALVALLRELKIGEEHVFGAAKPNPL